MPRQEQEFVWSWEECIRFWNTVLQAIMLVYQMMVETVMQEIFQR